MPQVLAPPRVSPCGLAARARASALRGVRTRRLVRVARRGDRRGRRCFGLDRIGWVVGVFFVCELAEDHATRAGLQGAGHDEVDLVVEV